ncbi:endolysin [Streptomyces phage LibertyBell]|nr:endolysin [Streptomyces phage LibertyBell]
MTTWEKASESLSKIDSATRSKAREIFDAAQASGHDIWYMWGYDNNPSNTEHHSGRALDLMVRNEAAGDWIRDYIWANRERLKVQHVIWEQHITSTVTQPGVRRKMADRGNSTQNHYDHNHVLFFQSSYVAPGGTKPTEPPRKSVTEVAKAVLRGEYGNDPQRSAKLRTEGYNPAEVQSEVNRIMGGDPVPTKSNRQVAGEVIDGKWGNGDDRVNRLKKAGYDPKAIQAEVNRLLGRKTNTQIAREVIAGKWGNGSDRVRRLKAAGYNPDQVQAEVNRLV